MGKGAHLHHASRYALALCSLLVVLLIPLMNTSSYAANASDSGAVSAGRAVAGGAGQPGQPVVVNPGATLPTSSQFDIIGLIQAMTLDTPNDPHSGGSITLNNHRVIVPRELIVILPANALTWQELFAQAPAPYGIPGQPGVTVSAPTSGLAMADVPTPISNYEVHVVGNVVGDRYIAGMINISQQTLNTGAGYITFIDYNVGPNGRSAEMRVGGTMNDPSCVAAVPPATNAVAGGPSCSGARVRINDPLNPGVGTGRFGRPDSADVRFTVDQDNPTIVAATGFPMCLPRTRLNPAATAPGTNTFVNSSDPECPVTNRPLDPTRAGGFALTTNTVIGGAIIPGYIPDATKQAPMEVGDYITYAGTLMNDTATPTVAVPAATTYIAAHTISDNFAVYTQPGVNPAYVSIEVSIVGTGGLTVVGAAEAAVRTRFEGMTTDPTRNVHLYGIDISPSTGALNDRDWGYVSPDPGPPNGAVMGRWRFQPPCTATIGTVSDKKCVGPLSGDFIPGTREVRAVIDGVVSNVTPNAIPGSPAGFTAPLTASSPTAGNGIAYGQYHAPISEYIFPENIPGAPIVANNFEALPFLAYGGYTSAGGTVAGQLNPWPGAIAPPPPVCVTPSIVGGPYSVANGSAIQLVGNVNAAASGPVSLHWSASAGLLSNQNTATPSFSAISLPAGPVTVTLTAFNVCGPKSVSTTVNISASPPPTVSPVLAQSVSAGSLVSISAASSSLGPLNFTFTQTGGTSVLGGTNTRLINGIGTGALATISFVAPSTPGNLSFSVTATNVYGTSSPMPFTVAVTAPATVNIVLNPADYRIAKQRLVITATTNDLSAGTSLTLQPYLTQSGTIFDPSALGNVFTNTGGGIFTLTLVGAPEPAADLTVPGAVAPYTTGAKPLIVTSNHGGTSAPTALTRVTLN